MPGPPIRWWNRLGAKLAVAVAVVTLVVLGVFVLLAVRVQQAHLTNEVVRSAALFSDTIKSGTYHFMLEDRRAEVYRIMETIGAQEGIEKVRIFNKDGQITFSTDRTETGGFVDKRGEACYACHATDQPIVRLALSSRSRIYGKNGYRLLAMVTPIYNERGCATAACHAHPASKRVLGVVDVVLSLKEADAGLLALERRTLALSSLALLGVAGLVVLATRRFVARPVSRLVEATHRVARGELDHEIPVRAADEIGALASSFNQMMHSLERAQGELRQLMEGLEQQVEERTAALRTAHAQLIQSEKMASLGTLAASIAHEINNPLAGILTTTKLLLRTLAEGLPDERSRQAFVRQLSLVERETHRCTAIVRNLLDFARQGEPSLREIDVNACLDEALALVGNQLKIQSIAVERRAGVLPAVRADFGQIRQALLNVLLNACEAMPRGGTLTVATRPVPEARRVEIRIADTGAGVPPEHLSKIFDPFFTTKEKGTGLGLSVVYGVVQRHGGTVHLDSTVGKGTTMVIRLPVAPAAADEVAAA